MERNAFAICTEGLIQFAVSATRWLLPVGRWRNINLKLRASSITASGMSEAAVSHKTNERAGSELYETTDGLRSVHKLGGADVPDTWFDEHMAVMRQDKSLWMLVRTTYGIGNAVSTDDGHTWTSQGDTKLGRVNSRFFIRRLKSGNLLLVCNLPESGNARTNMVARLSTDNVYGAPNIINTGPLHLLALFRTPF